MRAVVQRVTRATLTIKDTDERREIGAGLVLLAAMHREDTLDSAQRLVDKVLNLRIFEDDHGKMNRSLIETTAPHILVVSQFTLYGDTRKGRRPSFADAAPPETAIPIYERIVTLIRASGTRIETGEFGADMAVELVNDGPVTLIVDIPPTN